MSERGRRFSNLLFRVIFTSFGAIFELLALAFIVDRPIDLGFFGLVILLISLIYTWDFYREYAKQLTTIQDRFLEILQLALFAGFLFIVWILGDLKIALLSLFLMIIGLLYDPYFKHLTRKFTGFKDFFVITCFEITIILFFILNKVPLIESMLLLSFVVSRDFINITYCDIKDIPNDSANGLKTIARSLGINKLINLYIVISLISIATIVLGSFYKIIPSYSLFLIIPVLITTILILYSHKTKKYSPNFVDIEYFNWLIFVFLGKIILWN